MSARKSPQKSLLVNLLVSFSIIGFLLFLIRLALFWLGFLPTFGTEIDNNVISQWVLTFIFNSSALFLGRYLQNLLRDGQEFPPMLKAITLVMVLLLIFQVYSIVFRSWAGLTYNQIINQQTEPAGPFGPS